MTTSFFNLNSYYVYLNVGLLLYNVCVCETENLRGFTFFQLSFNVTFSHMVVFEQIVFNAQLNFVFSKINCLFAPVYVMQLV